MPLRFVWGAQKGGTTGLWDMLHGHLACGANKRFGNPGGETYREEKESHYLVSVRGAPSRVAYMETFLLEQCESHCFVDATPDNLMVPFAAARLHLVMSSAEAVRSRPKPCIAGKGRPREHLAALSASVKAHRAQRLALQPQAHASPTADAHASRRTPYSCTGAGALRDAAARARFSPGVFPADAEPAGQLVLVRSGGLGEIFE